MRNLTIDDTTFGILRAFPSLLADVLSGASVAAQPDAADESIRHDTPLDVAIAAACHEANRQYARTIGDTSILGWGETSGLQRASMIVGVRAIESGDVTTPEQSHERWMQHKLDEGWTYGPQKSEVAKTHPCLLPFAQLPTAHQRKDVIFFTLASALLGKRLIISTE